MGEGYISAEENYFGNDVDIHDGTIIIKDKSSIYVYSLNGDFDPIHPFESNIEDVVTSPIGIYGDTILITKNGSNDKNLYIFTKNESGEWEEVSTPISLNFTDNIVGVEIYDNTIFIGLSNGSLYKLQREDNVWPDNVAEYSKNIP